MSNPIETFLNRHVLRQWERAARDAETLDAGALALLRRRARDLQKRVGKALFAAESRLAMPGADANTIQRPLHCDWAYRPQIWRGPVHPPGLAAVASKTALGDELKVFHDCEHSELTLRQVRNPADTSAAPFGLQLDVFRFDGNFLSLVVELPTEAVTGLERRHMIRLSAEIEVERPLEVFARLNIKNGPNVEQIVHELPMSDDDTKQVEFDLAYTKLNEKRVEQMWLDLVFEGAEMNQILLRDVTLTRRPRAEI